MKRVVRVLLMCCLLVSLFGVSPGRAMYVDPTREGRFDELLEYIETHKVLLEAEDDTEFGSLDAVKKEMERREKNWRGLVTQEWGVSFLFTLVGFGDLGFGNWAEGGSEVVAEAILFTPFRAELAMLAGAIKEYGEEEIRRWAPERLRELEKLPCLYLKFIVRSFPDFDEELSALLRYGNKELKSSFSYQRQSKIFCDKAVRYEEYEPYVPLTERAEWKKLGFSDSNSMATFLYMDFRIEEQGFDPEGTVELSLVSDGQEVGVFIADLSKMK